MERHAVLYFDGSFRKINNHSIAHSIAYGGWLAEIGGDVCFSAFDSFIIPDSSGSTNAEWTALVGGLTWLKAMLPFGHLDIRGDCDSVISALLNRSGLTKKTGDVVLALRAIALIDEISDSYNATKISRKENKISDMLAGRMVPSNMTDKRSRINKIKKSTIPTIAVKALAEYLWRSAGQPQDRDIHFWLAAEKFIAKI